MTSGVKPVYDGEKRTLESILIPTEEIPDDFIISNDKRLPQILEDYREFKLTEEVFKRHPQFFVEYPEIKKWMAEKGSKKKISKGSRRFLRFCRRKNDVSG